MAITDPRIVIRAKDETSRAFKAARSNLREFRKSALSLSNVLAGLAGAAGFGAMIKSSLEAQDQIGKLSTRLGASTEALSQYKFVAEQTGISFQTLTMGWQRMTRRISEAANGTGEARDALKELGLSAKSLNQLAPEQQFERLAAALRNVERPADRVRLAMKLFDSEGVSLLQTIGLTADETDRLKNRADELGLTLSQNQVDAAARSQDAMNELKNAFNGLAITLTNETNPALTDTTKLLTDFIPKAAGWARKITETMGVAGTFVWELLNPSDITGRPTLEQAMNRATEGAADVAQGLHEVKAARDALAAPTDDGTETPGSAAASKTELKALADFAFEDAKVRQHILDTRYEQNRLAQQAEFDATMEFEDRKTAAVRQGSLARLKFSTWAAKKQTQHVVKSMIQLTQGVAHQDRKLFEINKAAGIANAIINTHEGVSKSLSKYPWPLAGVMAAIHLAAGMAEVSAIRSASFGGGGGGRGVTGAGAATVPLTPPSDFATPAGGRTGPTEVSITVNGTGKLDRDQAQEIAESLADLISDGGEVFAI